jgi:hypothetical protein
LKIQIAQKKTSSHSPLSKSVQEDHQIWNKILGCKFIININPFKCYPTTTAPVIPTVWCDYITLHYVTFKWSLLWLSAAPYVWAVCIFPYSRKVSNRKHLQFVATPGWCVQHTLGIKCLRRILRQLWPYLRIFLFIHLSSLLSASSPLFIRFCPCK